MWNTKRLLLLGLGFVLFTAGYIVYAYFLGGIDGLPPLPAPFRPTVCGDKIPPPPPNVDPEVDRKLKIAFGQGCKEIERAIKLEMRKKGLVMAAEQATPEPDGRIKLTPMSAAIWGADKKDGKYPEINTVKCDTAYLTFDQPVSNITELGNRKLVAAELIGNVTIINNRRTPAIHDDIEVRVFNCPLHYDDTKNRIWSDGHVELLDKQTQPHPTLIRGKGLELFLTREDSDPKRAKKDKTAAKSKGEPIHAVERIVLLTNVEMHLYPDGNSGFMVSTKNEPEKKPAQQKGAADKDTTTQRSHVVIRTPGPFNYDVVKDLACFDSPGPGSPNAGEPVHVLRHEAGLNLPDLPWWAAYEAVWFIHDKLRDKRKDDMNDQLFCDHLELQFQRKKTAGPTTERDTQSTEREIVSALATAREGGLVSVAMDTEHLEATCRELLYNAPTAARGPQTVLKGSPVDAIKEGHKIKAEIIVLTGADHKGNGQQVTAKGPGRIDLYDSTNAKNPFPVHAVWLEMLVSTKDKEGERLLDLLTFTGEAKFRDDEHDQQLEGERLMLWLEPNEQRAAAPPPRPPQGKGDNQKASRQRPSKVEAFEHVKARAPEMLIERAEHFIIRFEDGVPVLPEQVASAPPPATPHTSAKPAATGPELKPPSVRNGSLPAPPPAAPVASTPSGARPPAATPPPAQTKEEKKEEKKPIHLWARDVSAYVARNGEKNDLRRLVAEGNVHVKQDGSKPEDKGVDIVGELLVLDHHVAGDILEVFGDARGPAELQLSDLTLIGPKVKIDQQKNIAHVKGVGAMKMPSNASFDGTTPAKQGTILTVNWTDDMVFNGKDADFQGGVVALQDNGLLKSQTLQVTLDKTVSFKEGQKGGQGAKVEKLVAHNKVYTVDSVFEKDQLVKYQRLVASEVAANNPEGKLIARGPGRLWALQKGSADHTASKPAPGAPAAAQPAKKQEEVMKLTRVDFQDHLFSDQPQPKGERISKFYGDVKVLNLPADRPDLQVDVDHPPKGAFYMTSDFLAVRSKPVAGGKTQQEMYAKSNVYFRTVEFFGRADVVTYDEAKDQVVFHGNPTTLYRRKAGRPGQQYEEIKGRMILYNRQTGVFIIDGGQQINLNQ